MKKVSRTLRLNSRQHKISLHKTQLFNRQRTEQHNRLNPFSNLRNSLLIMRRTVSNNSRTHSSSHCNNSHPSRLKLQRTYRNSSMTSVRTSTAATSIGRWHITYPTIWDKPFPSSRLTTRQQNPVSTHGNSSSRHRRKSRSTSSSLH